MREILFRGKGNKKYNDGDWYYGVPIQCDDGDWQICTNCSKRTVVAETIGEYTGLTDKNGTRIFEGDIIKCISRFDAKDMVVIFETAEFHLVDCQRYKNYTECCGYKYFGTLETEVIGNIHDNPELLRGDKE